MEIQLTAEDKFIMARSNPKIKTRVQNLLDIIPRQALHAKTLGFYHPHLNKSVSFNSDLPDDMQLLIKNLKTTSS